MTTAKNEGGLGFKEFEGFNDALLAKTAWRILQFPEAKWVRILKSLYFPTTSFMKAKKGGRPSWGWSSIIHGRELLRDELCWKIGTGHYIEVWNDPWIAENPDGLLKPKEGSMVSQHMMVAELIEGRRWNLNPVASAIESSESAKISNIPLSEHSRDDKLYWKGSKSGTYSVRKAYRLRKGKVRFQPSSKASSSQVLDERVWTKLWKIKVIPRIRHFIWRIMNKAVASNEALYRRHCAAHPYCPYVRRKWRHLSMPCCYAPGRREHGLVVALASGWMSIMLGASKNG